MESAVFLQDGPAHVHVHVVHRVGQQDLLDLGVDVDLQVKAVLQGLRGQRGWLRGRTVGGENENYITPEQSVPSGPIRVPWESCVTVGYAFSYRFADRYKTPRQLVHLLTDVVCRGGNLALNIAPQPDGTLPAAAVREKTMPF